jgi:ankyrin repeat protein
MALPEDICSGISDQFMKKADGEEVCGSFSQIAKALMPENVFSNNSVSMQMTASADHQSSVLNFLNLTMFLVSNNFLGTTSDVSKKVYEWVKRRSNAALLEHLLSISGPTAEALAENLFRLAIDADDVRTVKKIIESGIDPNEQIWSGLYDLKLTPLQRACRMHSLELVRVLLDAGADVNRTVCKGKSALWYVFDWIEDHKEGPLAAELVQLLLRAGAKANPGHGKSPLFLAAELGCVEIVASLISAGADVNFSEDEYGATPLIAAVENKWGVPDEDFIDVVRKLLQAGADVHATAVYAIDGGTTALETATFNPSIELLKLLLDNGALITDIAFFNVVTRGNLDIAKLFLEYGARVTPTVIERAAQRTESELALFLLDSAEDSIKERSSSAALISAICHGRDDLINKLDASGVQLHSTPELTATIVAAARRGDIRVLRLLLGDNSRHQASVIGSSGESLCAAIASGREEITELLLAAGVAVNAGNDLENESPLLAAIRRKDAHLAWTLLAAGAAVSGVNKRRPGPVFGLQFTTTVLPAVVAWGDHPLIQEIISAGAEVNAPLCEGGETALTLAVAKRDATTIQLLIDAGADVNFSFATLDGRSTLEAAVRNYDIGMVNYLLSLGADADEGSLVAAVSWSVELVQILLAARLRRYQGCSIGYGCGALQHALRLGNAAMVEALLANGVDPNVIVRPTIGNLGASFRRSYSAISYGESFRRSYSAIIYGESALGTAITTDKSSQLWFVHMLLLGGANPKGIVMESPKLSALLAAISQKSLPLVTMLIAAGADANAGTNGGISRTPLQLAAEKGSMDIVLLLLEHGVDVNASPADRYGATALQLAAIGGYAGIAYVLLERGAEVNALPAKVEGRTALEGAAEHGRIDVLQLLLSAGAQITGPDGEQYERARELATKNGHIAARHLLESHKARWAEVVVD